MASRPDFTSRGNLQDAQLGLVRFVDHRALWRGWAMKVARGSRAAPWASIAVAYLVGWAALLPTGASWALCAALLHGAYLPLLWIFYKVTYSVPVLEPRRVRRLQSWLEQTRAALPEDVSLDVHARLTPDGCRGRRGHCGSPWMESFLYLEDGSVVRIQVTDGKACPLARVTVPPGRTMLEFELASDDPGVLSQLSRHLSRQRESAGVCTRLVEPISPYRLRWVLDQEVAVAGEGLPVWPLLRLLAVRRRFSDPLALPAGGLSLLEAASESAWSSTSESILLGGAFRRRAMVGSVEGGAIIDGAARGHASRSGRALGELVAASARLPLTRINAVADHRLEGRWRALWSSSPSPSSTMFSLGLALNGAVGVSALVVSHLTSWAPLTGAMSVPPLAFWAWLSALVVSASVGVARLSPVALAVWRAKRAPERVVGALDVAQDGLRLTLPEGRAHAALSGRVAPDLDFDKPFSTSLTRHHGECQAPAGDGVRVHLTLSQRDERGQVRRSGFSAVLSSSPVLRDLPVKDESGYPELSPQDFRWLYETLRRVSAAHGEPMASLPVG